MWVRWAGSTCRQYYPKLGNRGLPICVAEEAGRLAKGASKARADGSTGPVYGQAGMLRFHLQTRPNTVKSAADVPSHEPNTYVHLRPDDLVTLTEQGIANFNRTPPLCALMSPEPAITNANGCTAPNKLRVCALVHCWLNHFAFLDETEEQQTGLRENAMCRPINSSIQPQYQAQAMRIVRQARAAMLAEAAASQERESAELSSDAPGSGGSAELPSVHSQRQALPAADLHTSSAVVAGSHAPASVMTASVRQRMPLMI